MNLLYRMKANISENEAESAASLSIADEWVEALAARRLEAASSPRSNTSPRSNPWTAAPPPPPPPPPPPISDTALTSDAPMPPRLNTKERPGTFWQVMGAGDTHAKTLIAQLKAQGFRASPAVSGGDMLVRVVVVSLTTTRPRSPKYGPNWKPPVTVSFVPGDNTLVRRAACLTQ